MVENKQIHTALHLACLKGHDEIVKQLLGHFNDGDNNKKQLLDTEDEEGNTALHLACENGSVKVVTILEENGADTICRDRFSETLTPINIAAQHGHTEVVKHLLMKKPEIAYERDKSRKTLLHYAVLANDSELIKGIEMYLPIKRCVLV